jgi:hypothetical protein
MSRLHVRTLNAADVAARAAGFAAFERAFVYPLGNDSFHIDHGADYLAFFRSLGEPFPYVAETERGIAGVLVAVRRRLAGHDVWYVCDLKVAPGAGSGSIGRQLLRTFASEHLAAATTPAFGISMNAADGSNRLAAIARRCVEAGDLQTAQLVFFTFSFDTLPRVANVLEQALGNVAWFDPRGTKDIVLASTNAPMPLLHAQHGPCARPGAGPARPGNTHMLCLPANDPLAAALAARGAQPMATATILHRGLPAFDWRHVLTSDI